ncbi:hypothetical protein AAHA92_24976 [Salvia divinorum]|uniref:Uncharacterized protein n=1 Tax=Salvia divinorum TaxID=28513 RepID=A0ABD1G995_SALDI
MHEKVHGFPGMLWSIDCVCIEEGNRRSRGLSLPFSLSGVSRLEFNCTVIATEPSSCAVRYPELFSVIA